MRVPISFISTSFLLLVLAGCASSGDPPGPGEARGPVPDLRGRRVLVLPVQLREGTPVDLTIDEEIAYALPARSGRVSWAFPDEVERILRRSPGVQASLHGLPVGIFLQAEVNRIGDPLYGQIRRMTTLVGADVALIPVQLAYTDQGRYALSVAILNPVTGRVPWFGIVEGEPGAPDSPAAVASVVEALARRLLPQG